MADCQLCNSEFLVCLSFFIITSPFIPLPQTTIRIVFILICKANPVGYTVNPATINSGDIIHMYINIDTIMFLTNPRILLTNR